MKYNLIYILFFLSLVSSCGRDYTPEEKLYVQQIKQLRTEKNQEMKNSPESPFNFKGKVHFENLKYFDVDPEFVFKSKLYEYDTKDTIKIYGTKGEERKAIRYGYVKFHYDKDYKINVYKGFSKSGEEYFSIWFTDKTTNEESYGVGRYIDFEKNENKDYVYTIDFNMAYNPYCAYSPKYSCAVPTREDYIDLAIKAGEKKFH